MGRKLRNLPQEDKPKKTKAQRRSEARVAMESLRHDVLRYLDRADEAIVEAQYLVDDLHDELFPVDRVLASFRALDLSDDLDTVRDKVLEVQRSLKKSGIDISVWDN